ncbi:hypothetical protein C1925_03585 [Stenotrophomonas sp. SAU14A_NAIMI4_5]|uniref:hypothetical protein n=1 Tax=Stenotrophomonas sp. SAU14A_NAIMI4_5 TaxID=2072413 RepID=UPI000D53F06A|nr:hypothetical protein [Stenotrophomonas sp. SAU14A_NAIMI4_5]AWH48309.1 hypothetical protein C1925_03585 [Stenotrophomonas sp. SAU14A_NAIMI4_5]
MKWTTVLLLLAALWPGTATAQVVEKKVTGIFRPNALDPGNTGFENTTPRGSLCNWRPGDCQRRNAYIFDLGNREYWRKQGTGDNASRRNTLYFGLPPPRMVTFTNVDSGHSFQAAISFVAFSMRLDFTNGADPFTGGVAGDCTSIAGAGGLGWSTGGWAVRNPSGANTCYSSRTRNNRVYRYRNVGIGIDVQLPSAMTLQDGRYTAVESWTTGGADADIDLGDNITGVQAIQLNFEFDVQHDFQVRFPVEHPRVLLAPDGGWSQWVDYGRRPSRLRQELPFHLTSSMDFSMKLRCEYPADGDRCGIRDTRGSAIVPVDVDVTLPGMVNERDGRPAQFTSLTPVDAGAPRFTSPAYLRNLRSVLRFIAGQAAVDEMVKAPGSQWRGDITIVFDANP